MTVVDLSQWSSSGSRVFSGRDRGREVRAQAELNRLDTEGDQVTVRVPPETFSITSSFFLGMFGQSVRALGESEFRRRYQFDIDADLLPQIDHGIRYAQRVSSPLSKPR